MLAVVVSRADSASEHIGEHLLDLADWTAHEDATRSDGDGGGTVYRADGVELREFADLHLEIERAGAAFGTVGGAPERDPDLLVFASRHAGETGPLLTAHHTGNSGPAEFGGDDGRLARACPAAHSRVLDALRAHAPAGYEVGMECTHHGPSAVGLPSMFVEVGSDEPQWNDPEAARAVATAILDLRDVDPDAPVEDPSGDGGTVGRTDEARDDRRRHLVGFGGGHYAPRFERVTRETDWAVGHVTADWGLDDLGDPADNRAVVRRLFEESAAAYALVDGDPAGVESVVEDLGYRVVSETWVRETGGSGGDGPTDGDRPTGEDGSTDGDGSTGTPDDDGDGRDPVPLWLVAALEDALCPVDDGLRFGDRARGDPPTGAGDTVIVDLPAALLAEAQGIDADAARTAVAEATLAFETTENGTRAAGRAAVADPADREAVVDGLVAVLRGKYESVERTDEAVLAHEEAFDPERARVLGIPDGPKFGRLANGQSVEIDGKTVEPADVHVEREQRFDLGE